MKLNENYKVFLGIHHMGEKSILFFYCNFSTAIILFCLHDLHPIVIIERVPLAIVFPHFCGLSSSPFVINHFLIIR